MPRTQYPEHHMVNFTEHSYKMLQLLANRDERNMSQQIRFFCNLCIWAEIGKVVVYLLGGFV